MKQDTEAPSEVRSALQSSLRLKIIPGLDAVRAAAVSMVVFFHFGYLPASCGELGVMLFFVLSGFLITRILLMEYLKSGTISLREFYRRRTLRIFPTFYVCWLIETLLIALHREHIRWWGAFVLEIPNGGCSPTPLFVLLQKFLTRCISTTSW